MQRVPRKSMGASLGARRSAGLSDFIQFAADDVVGYLRGRGESSNAMRAAARELSESAAIACAYQIRARVVSPIR
jgi:hypothetical protein